MLKAISSLIEARKHGPLRVPGEGRVNTKKWSLVVAQLFSALPFEVRREVVFSARLRSDGRRGRGVLGRTGREGGRTIDCVVECSAWRGWLRTVFSRVLTDDPVGEQLRVEHLRSGASTRRVPASRGDVYLIKAPRSLLKVRDRTFTSARLMSSATKRIETDASRSKGRRLAHVSHCRTVNQELGEGVFRRPGNARLCGGCAAQGDSSGIACVKHQKMSGSDIGDDHMEYSSGEAALKAAGKDNTINQF